MKIDFTAKYFLLILFMGVGLFGCFEVENGDNVMDTGSDTITLHGDSDSDTSSGTDTNIVCVYKGTTYQMGDVISSIPGAQCNDCECDNSGEVSCVDTECVPEAGCFYNGIIYETGETFAAADGCNSCSCMADGAVSCTEMYCGTQCSDPTYKMFEPGCGGDEHTRVIEEGCFESCSGTPCTSGICQLTDVNPCVCETGTDCCNACGMATWLCLDEPEDCSAVDERFFISGGGKSFGECTGECRFELATHINSSGNCATATLTVYGITDVTRTNTGELTALGTALVSGLAVELAGVSLEQVYGCPDCADGGAGRLTLTRDSNAFATAYEFRQPPEILKRADDFIAAVMVDLDECENSEYVVPSASCVPGSE